MKTNSIQAHWARRLVAVTMTGTFIAAPLMAQAAPPRQAPAWGQRNQHDKKGNVKPQGRPQQGNNANRPGNQSHHPTASYHPNTTYNRPGNSYNRPNNSHHTGNNTYRPGSNNTYRPGSNNRPGGTYTPNVRQNFGGVVTGRVSGNQFTMRSDSGKNITVHVQQTGQMNRISRGDRVLVAGYFQSSNVFTAQDLNFLQDR